MASLTLSFTANAATIRITGLSGAGNGVAEFSNSTGHLNPLVRAAAQEWQDNATAAGTLTIAAA